MKAMLVKKINLYGQVTGAGAGACNCNKLHDASQRVTQNDGAQSKIIKRLK